MSKEFVVEKRSDYFKSYLKSIVVILPTLLFAISNIYKRDFPYKKEALMVSGLIVIIVAASGIKKFLEETAKRYIVRDHGIQIIKSNQIDSYEFARLKKIKRTSAKQNKKTGFDTLVLEFDNNKKLRVDSSLPFYHEFRTYLKDTLKTGGYYDRIELKNEL